MIGASFSQYRITATLGARGTGEVFRALDTPRNRNVAVKGLPMDFAVGADRIMMRLSTSPWLRLGRFLAWCLVAGLAPGSQAALVPDLVIINAIVRTMDTQR